MTRSEERQRPHSRVTLKPQRPNPRAYPEKGVGPESPEFGVAPAPEPEPEEKPKKEKKTASKKS